MSLEILKQKILTAVNTLEDEVLLQDVLEMLSDNGFNKNETYYRNRLQESIKQADTGKILPSENVHQVVRQRVLACTKSSNEAWENEDDERWNAFLRD